MQKIILLFTVAFLLAACAPNPVDVAEGEAIRIQAEQAALDQEQARAHRQEIYEIEEAERRAITEQACNGR